MDRRKKFSIAAITFGAVITLVFGGLFTHFTIVPYFERQKLKSYCPTNTNEVYQGKRLVSTDVFATGVTGHGGYVEVVDNKTGAHIDTLTNEDGNVWDVTPTWSPDGKKILFARSIRTLNWTNRTIWIADSDGNNPLQLTFPKGNDWDLFPSFSHDGKQIIFTRGAETFKDRVMVMNVEGSDLHELPIQMDGIYFAQFTKDGHVVFDRTVDPSGNTIEVYVATQDGEIEHEIRALCEGVH